jgi:predicted phage-related endonuclease
VPDPSRQTLSATQVPALFGASPYLTRWMLARHFIHGDEIDGPEDSRMSFGKKMQPIVLEQAAADLHLEVIQNRDDHYLRRGLLGCTRDAEIICPDRGPGALECKCVYDYGVWMRDWAGGKRPPRHYEIQCQQQMAVGAGDGSEPFQWGVIAAWVCGEMHYFERKPLPDLWAAIEIEAARFFEDVAAGREGDPFGAPIEAPLLNRLFPVIEAKRVDFTAREDAAALAQDVADWQYWKTQEAAAKKSADRLGAKIKGLMTDAEEGLFANGIRVTQKTVRRAGYTVKPSQYNTLSAYVPAGLEGRIPIVDEPQGD